MSVVSSPHPGARGAALALLLAVLARRRPLDEAMTEQSRAGGGLAGLEVRDRAFARLLVATVLRRLGQIDAILALCLAKPLPEDAAERQMLRLGVAQLLFLATPPHAAVDGTMRLVDPVSPYRGLVNAVLRRIAREGQGMLAEQDAPRLNTPEWLWRRWCANFGEAQTRAIALAHQGEPPLDISVKGEPASWAGRLDAVVLPTGSLRRAGGAVEAMAGFAAGAWWVQDAAAALPARLLRPGAGDLVLDLCAAPGGKTAQLVLSGAEVVAVERQAGRIERLRGNLARLGLSAEIAAHDAVHFRPARPADAVLLDAPCSATGTIRRHPDVAHLKRAEDLVPLARAQSRLLAAALAMLRPGGRLVYCVCSLEPEEGPERIAALLASGAPAEREPILEAEVPGLAEAITPEGALRTLPSHWAEAGGLDGFYACRLRRR